MYIKTKCTKILFISHKNITEVHVKTKLTFSQTICKRCSILRWFKCSMFFVFCYFFNVFVATCICDLLHDMETVRYLCLHHIEESLFLKMSDACETAYCHFPGITHIS